MNLILAAAALILATSQAITIWMLIQKNNRIKRLAKLSEIGRKITSNIKIKPLMKEIMQIAKTELGAEASSLYLVDEERQELWFEVALGEKGEQVKEIRLKIGEGIAGWVAKEGVTLNLKDVNQDTRFKRDIGKKIDFQQKAMLTMPVKFMSKTIGVLQLINKKGGGFFTNQDEELLEGMSSQVAIALENARLYKEIRIMLVDSISSLAGAIDAKDPYTNGHSKRVTEYSMEIGRAMGLSEEELENLEFMALLHDVGKIGIQDSVLNKPSRLTEEEYIMMKSHPLIGEKILGPLKSMSKIVPGVKYHHEEFDGTGYLEGLSGDAIPLEARIISVADTYDAMTTTRPYRKGLEHKVASEEINKNSGTQFDPEVVKCFNKVMERKQMIQNENSAV